MKPKASLNALLNPVELKVCVPQECDFLLDGYRGRCRQPGRCPSAGTNGCADCAREAYFRDIGAVDAPEVQAGLRCGKNGTGRLLQGRIAIEHARRVHASLYRQLLRYDNVTAVDVGFAVEQRRQRFLNAIAIRIHVGTKHPVSVLRRKQLLDLVDPRWAQESQNEGESASTFERTRSANPWLGWGISQNNLTLVEIPDPSGPEGSAEQYQTEASDGEQKRPEPRCCPCCGRRCQEACKKCAQCCYCCRCKGKKRSCIQAKTGGCRRCRLAICGVPLDVIEANYFPAGSHPGGDFPDGVFVDRMEDTRGFDDEENLLIGRGRVSPLVGGISVGSDNGLAGTLGAIVWDETDGSPCVLGNWHVLAGRGAKTGQPCYQPAIFDGGDDGDVIGHLKRWHFGELGDAAIAELDGSRYFASGEILGLWHPISGYRPPELNLTVRKWGRTTGFSEGFIDGIHLATALKYDKETVRHFEQQFHIAPLYRGDKVSQVGDSGSIVVSATHLDDLESELDDLTLVARTMLRPERVPHDELKALVGDASIKDTDHLIEKVKALLQKYPTLSRAPVPSPSDFATALAQCREGGSDAKLLDDFRELLRCVLGEYGITVEKYQKKKVAETYRHVRRVYHAVGMIFAGDTPGSPFGEFALASDIGLLAKDMRFSLRPVFEPRSSFRKLRSRPPRRGRGGAGPRGRSFEPGDPGSDPRGGGPQPDGAGYQSGGGNTGGG